MFGLILRIVGVLVVGDPGRLVVLPLLVGSHDGAVTPVGCSPVEDQSFIIERCSMLGTF